MNITVETTKLIVEHLQSIFPDAECKRSYLPVLEPEELNDKIVLCVAPVGGEAEKFNQGGTQKIDLAIDICINARLDHRNDEPEAFNEEIDKLIVFAEKVHAAFLKKIVVSAGGLRAAFDQPEHLVFIHNEMIQARNCFFSVVRVNAEVFAKPEV
jgi:hypothetical protein